MGEIYERSRICNVILKRPFPPEWITLHGRQNYGDG